MCKNIGYDWYDFVCGVNACKSASLALPIKFYLKDGVCVFVYKCVDWFEHMGNRTANKWNSKWLNDYIISKLKTMD